MKFLDPHFNHIPLKYTSLVIWIIGLFDIGTSTVVGFPSFHSCLLIVPFTVARTKVHVSPFPYKVTHPNISKTYDLFLYYKFFVFLLHTALASTFGTSTYKVSKYVCGGPQYFIRFQRKHVPHVLSPRTCFVGSIQDLGGATKLYNSNLYSHSNAFCCFYFKPFSWRLVSWYETSSTNVSYLPAKRFVLYMSNHCKHTSHNII